MSQDKRKSIERKIRELSLQLEKDLLAQQKEKQGREPQIIDMVVLDAMLDEWDKLAKYYEDNLYKKNTQQDIGTDLEISLFIVKNYLNWTYGLQAYKAGAAKRGEQENAVELEEALVRLEMHMKQILDALMDYDDLAL